MIIINKNCPFFTDEYFSLWNCWSYYDLALCHFQFYHSFKTCLCYNSFYFRVIKLVLFFDFSTLIGFMLIIFFYYFRIITCIYRKNASKLEKEVKAGRENLYQKTEKLRKVSNLNIHLWNKLYWLLHCYKKIIFSATSGRIEEKSYILIR